MNRIRTRLQIAAAAALAVWALGLAGCGGGSADAVASDPVRDPSAAGKSVLTVPEYAVLREQTAGVAGGAEPDAAAQAALRAGNHHLAVAQLGADLQGGIDNPAVAPPLSLALVRSLGAAAAGESLAEIASRYELAPTPWVAAQQTSRLTSQLWAQSGQRLRAAFLAATDLAGPWPRLASWSAAETGFADGSAAGDSALTQPLAAAGLSLGSFDASTDIRLLVSHALGASAAWAAVAPFEGVFERGYQDLRRLPLVRLSAGVSRQSGIDYTADRLQAGDLQLLSLRPASGTLRDFAANRLEAALAEALDALQANVGAPVAGELLLPVGDLSLPQHADAALRQAGVALVFDEVQANLRGLDGVGGTYAQTASSPAALHIGADGLSLRAVQALAYTYSPRNVNGGGTSGGITTVFNPGNFYFGCVWPTPDLRSFFLAILDNRNWVVALVAIQAPGGTEVVPDCGN